MTIVEVIAQQPLTVVEINSFVSVPAGGLDGQVLTKASNSNYDFEWTNVAGSETNLSVTNRTTTSLDVSSSTGLDATIPEATTFLAGLLNSTDKTKLNSLVTVATTGSYTDLINIPTSFNPSAHNHVIADITGLQTALNGKFNNPTGDTTQYVAGDGSLVSFPIAGQSGTLVRQVRNETGTTLTKGTVVYVSGASGNKPLVDRALASSDTTSAQTFGVVQADISNNQNGYVVVKGDLIGLDTTAYTEGMQLYLSGSVAGTFQTTKPVAPTHMVYVGVVTRSHATQGQVEVGIQNGYELDELHDVLIVSKTNKDAILYDSVSGLWKNRQLATSDVVGLDTSLSNKQPLSSVLTNTTASFTTSLETKLNGIAAGATVNSSDATLLNRANHTGTQLASTISDFNTAADARVVAGITSKQPNIQFQDEGSNAGTSGGVTTVNFTGSGVTASHSDGTLTVNIAGGISRVIINTIGAATLPSTTSTDYAVFIDGAHNQTMPTAVGNTNKYDIKNNHSSNVTISTTSAQTIDGTTTISLSPQSAVTLISNGSNWSIF